MKYATLITLLTSMMFAQNAVRTQESDTVSPWPHPFTMTNISLNGPGYSSISPMIGAGIDLEHKHWNFLGYADYNFVRKSNDGTSGNNNGHTRMIHGDLGFRIKPHVLMIGGYGFGQTYTTNYWKQASIWDAGLGYDSPIARLTATYKRDFNERTNYPNQPGCACKSGVNGADVNVWLPSLSSHRHFFFHSQVSVFRYHTSEVDPSNLSLTRLDDSQHHWGAVESTGLVVRF